ncbi:NUDIX hydrolase [Frankia sp. Cppng1_Ct_nod]|uniref:NUDIX hydrolase n=1 Tax=Frankia sp. Cppng1_Ct_nod TaxID=2897162 RepID=UPI0010417EF7|nr:NUDIX hydrolase [Frankia sp. Cppng1_Ct_nod]
MADLTGNAAGDLLARLRQRVPPDLAERARAFRPDHDTPTPPRDAATVVLLRDARSENSASGIEVCLLRRASTMAFAAGMYVFPGGKVDPADIGAELRWFATPEAGVAHLLGAEPALARALVCAAVRETFEECGVLLAGADADTVADVSDPGWESDRLALEGRQASLAAVLTRRGLGLRGDLLRPWARWVTPEIEPRRYDTRFFVAAMPAGQRTRRIPGESDRTLWTSPSIALQEHLAGRLGMLPPTALTLAELAEYDSVDAVLTASGARNTRPILPRIVIAGGEARLLLPHDVGYGPVHDGDGDGDGRDV